MHALIIEDFIYLIYNQKQKRQYELHRRVEPEWINMKCIVQRRRNQVKISVMIQIIKCPSGPALQHLGLSLEEVYHMRMKFKLVNTEI